MRGSASVSRTLTATTASLRNSTSFKFRSQSHREIIALPSSTKSKTSKSISVRAANNEKDDGKENNEATRTQKQPLSLEDVNPVGLGRKSRQIFDEVWRKFSGLGQISRTTRPDDKEALDALLIREGPMCEFAIPGAQNTTVLVVGGTSRIGRIVVRKLMLRGYTVKVFSYLLLIILLQLCRFNFAIVTLASSNFQIDNWGIPQFMQVLVRKTDQEVIDSLPRSVEIVNGDVGDPSTLWAAVEGCNKIIYCATARSAITGDLFRVDHQGVSNLTKAFQVCLSHVSGMSCALVMLCTMLKTEIVMACVNTGLNISCEFMLVSNVSFGKRFVF